MSLVQMSSGGPRNTGVNPENITPVQDDRPAPAGVFSVWDRLPAKRRLMGVAGLILVLGLFWYFSGHSRPSPVNEKHLAAAPVRVALVSRRDMAIVEHTLGRVIPNTMVQVTARVQGVLETANFKEGQFVKKGELLFQIDPRSYAATLEQARAILLRDQAQLRKATRDHQRIVSLHDRGNASTQQLDASATNAEMLAATVAADEAAVALAQLNFDYTQIRSPVDGKTGPILIQPGNMVLAGATTPLVTIAQMQPVKISFHLPQTELPRIQNLQKTRGLMATLDLRDANGVAPAAAVDFTDNAVNAQSGTIELRATFENADLSLVPGELVNVTVELENIPDALVVPRDAINDGPAGPFIYVVEGEKAVVRIIKILFDDSQYVAIDGEVKPGDRVVVEGQLRVVPNAPVSVQPSADGAPNGESPS